MGSLLCFSWYKMFPKNSEQKRNGSKYFLKLHYNTLFLFLTIGLWFANPAHFHQTWAELAVLLGRQILTRSLEFKILIVSALDKLSESTLEALTIFLLVYVPQEQSDIKDKVGNRKILCWLHIELNMTYLTPSQ